MKINHIAATLTLTALVACSSSYSRADDAAKTIAGATAAVDSTVKDAKAKADAAKAAAAETAKAQGLIDKAKTFVTEKKYQPALDTLAKVKNMKLTTEQTAMVDGLKGQIKTLMAASDTGKSLGGLLGK